MTPEQCAAFVSAQAAEMLVEMEGMKAVNVERERNGYALAYGEEAFDDLRRKYIVGHNQVLELFRSE